MKAWKQQNFRVGSHADADKACTHKLRLFGNRWLMSALPPIADIRRLVCDVRGR